MLRPWWLLLLLSFLNLVLVLVSRPLAHGVKGRLYQGPYLGIEAFYTDGTPMSYARVKVFLEGKKIPFQTGITDPHGRFLFAPDPPGRYRLVVEDGEGHRLEIKLETKKGANIKAQDSSKWAILPRLILGILIIFIFFKLLLPRKSSPPLVKN